MHVRPFVFSLGSLKIKKKDKMIEVECQCDRHEENYEILITMRVWKYLNGVPDNGKRNNVTNDSEDAVDEGNSDREENLFVTINTKTKGGVSRREDDLRESFDQ